MAYYKKFIILFLVLILLCGFCYATEGDDELESVTFNTINNMSINENRNYFDTDTTFGLGYFQLEKGYKYYITHSGQADRAIALSTERPAVNVTYTFLYNLPSGETFTYIANNDSTLYFNFSPYSQTTITREKVQNLDGAIGNLVENVGPNALWGVFGSGIDFVFVIVIVAFGIFIIVKIIKGLSKGKSKI